MKHYEIITHLSKITDPSEIIYSITMQEVLSAIARRMGNDAAHPAGCPDRASGRMALVL